VTANIASVQIPDSAPSSRLLPNAFMLKIDPNPAQCDLRVEAAPGGTFLPGDTVRLLFTIHNNGPGTAGNVLFSGSLQGGQLVSCRASGSGLCGDQRQATWASLASIRAGGSQSLELNVSSNFAPAANVLVTATASTVTSDINQDNNLAYGMSAMDAVQI